MTEWRDVTLGDVLTLQRGFDLTQKEATPGPFPVISSGGVSYTTEEAKVEGPGVITGRKGVLGKVHYSEGPYWPHDTTLWVKDFKGADPRYVYYLLHTLPLDGLDVGAANPTLNRNHAHLLNVRVPDRPGQETIGAVLGSLDDLIENNRRRVEVVEDMARSLYREWFVHFRFPGHEDASFAGSDLGPIPKGWCVQPLSSLAVVNPASRTPEEGETVRYLDISCLGDRTLETPEPVAGEDAPGRARRLVAPGDVVWSMVRPNRRAHAFLVQPESDWIASTGTAVLRATEVHSSYLFEFVSSRAFSDYLVSRQRGSAYPAVKVQDFKDAPVVLPTSQIVGRFADTVESMHYLSWTLREHSEQLAAIRDLLLPKLVTGKIDVSALDLDAVLEKAAV